MESDQISPQATSLGSSRSVLASQRQLGAIVFSDDQDVDAALLAVASDIIDLGANVLGRRQSAVRAAADACPVHFMASWSGDQSVRLSQDLGSLARGCRLDQSVLEAAANELCGAIGSDTDLIVLNRFGRAESEGRGMRTVIERAMDAGVPVLLAVRDRYLQAWRDYTVDLACDWPFGSAAVKPWAIAAARARMAARNGETARAQVGP